MEQITEFVGEFTRSETTRAGLRAAAILAAGLLTAYGVRRWIGRWVLHNQQTALLQRGMQYAIILAAAAWALRELGFDLATLLGAAGLLTVAIGFAAQTSISNVISGLFLLGEQPFVVGDAISAAGATGEVVSIDLISVRLRTFDNLMVRIPNEAMLKSNVTNLTHFPIRRVDLKLGVAYKEDLERVRKILEEIADHNPICLEEPRPLFMHLGFGDSAIDLQFSVWAEKSRFLDLRTGMYLAIKQAFDAHGIEIPFPHRTIYTGSTSQPMPLRLVGQQPSATGEPVDLDDRPD